VGALAPAGGHGHSLLGTQPGSADTNRTTVIPAADESDHRLQLTGK
jgi:hypothetical protein